MLPAEYAWLAKEGAPKILVEALTLFGIVEADGAKDNPIILSWGKELGLDYPHDSIPWCGLFAAIACHRAGYLTPLKPLWALSWAKWGNECERPSLGDVLTFVRPGGGHVGLYVGEDSAAFHVLGGNQHDSVAISRVSRQRMHSFRRTPWKIKQPANVRPISLRIGGALSANEA